MNDSPWNSQDVVQHCISGIDRLIYHHSVCSDNILMYLSQRCDFCYQALHCWQYFVETSVTLQAYFLQKMLELSWQVLFGTLTYQFFCICTVRKRFHTFANEAFTAHWKEGQLHFFDLMQTLYVDTSWSNRSRPPICLL